MTEFLFLGEFGYKTIKQLQGCHISFENDVKIFLLHLFIRVSHTNCNLFLLQLCCFNPTVSNRHFSITCQFHSHCSIRLLSVMVSLVFTSSNIMWPDGRFSCLILISISNTFQSLMPTPASLAPKEVLQSFFIS